MKIGPVGLMPPVPVGRLLVGTSTKVLVGYGGCSTGYSPPVGTTVGAGVGWPGTGSTSPPGWVVKVTSGTVMVVEMEVTDDEVVMVPSSGSHGTVMVVMQVIVVTGPVGGGVVTGSSSSGQSTMMPGLVGMCGAQIPWRHLAAFLISSLDAPWDFRQSKTFLVKSCLGQKQSMSEFDSHSSGSQVFRHCGRMAGQSSLSGGGGVVSVGIGELSEVESVGSGSSVGDGSSSVGIGGGVVLVQPSLQVVMVLVLVTLTVEMVVPVESEVVPSEVIVEVTSQVVTVSSVTTVVMMVVVGGFGGGVVVPGGGVVGSSLVGGGTSVVAGGHSSLSSAGGAAATHPHRPSTAGSTAPSWPPQPPITQLRTWL